VTVDGGVCKAFRCLLRSDNLIAGKALGKPACLAVLLFVFDEYLNMVYVGSAFRTDTEWFSFRWHSQTVEGVTGRVTWSPCSHRSIWSDWSKAAGYHSESRNLGETPFSISVDSVSPTMIPHGHKMTDSESILCPECGWTGEVSDIDQSRTDVCCPICAEVVAIVD